MSLPIARPMLLCCFAVLAPVVRADDAVTLETARDQLQRGRYADAVESYSALAKTDADAVTVAIGLSRAHQATGDWKPAAAVLDAALRKDAKNASLLARRAELYRLRGEFEQAERAANAALDTDPDQPLARLMLADVLTETGRLKEADAGYRWLVRYYNRVQPKDAESLLLVARGATEYARWHSVSQIFDFAVNTLCPDALKDDESSWQTYHISGALLLEKYNRAHAIPELEDALAINANAAPVLVALGEAALQKLDLDKATEYAERALKVDETNPPALQLLAEVALSESKPDVAETQLQIALKVDPHDQRTLALLAASRLLTDGIPDGERLTASLAVFGGDAESSFEPESRFETILVELSKRNRFPGRFLSELAGALDGRRQYAAAEVVYRRATTVMPQIAAPKTGLGMLYMRVGRTDEARTILDAAFKADPYHVRVSNTRKVLKVLGDYGRIETAHFIVRFDEEQDRRLAEAMAAYLEEIHPKYTKLYGFVPPGKTQIELYNEAKGISAHQWFSTRMIGLPWIQTIGATTGHIVAMASPNALPQKYNWAQVLRHEFVHVVTLQQTAFNIPHWFTEALAVTSEGYPRPARWNRLLLERVPERDLRTLANLTDAFVRPDNADDWQFAYCQSKLYADYMAAEFGAASVRKLLAAYERNESTTEAVPKVFGVDLETFEKGYVAFLDDLVAELKRGEAADDRTLEELRKAHESNTDDAAIAGAYALKLYDSGEEAEAIRIAGAVLETDPKQVEAALVVAERESRKPDNGDGVAILTAAVDETKPHARALRLLATMQVAAKEYDEAARLFEIGRKHYPHDVDWVKGTAAASLLSGNHEKLRDALVIVANTESDDVEPRRRLAKLALEDDDFETALDFATRGLHIDIEDGELHRLRGRALIGLKRPDDARRALRTAIEIDPDDVETAELLLELQ